MEMINAKGIRIGVERCDARDGQIYLERLLLLLLLLLLTPGGGGG